jgi:hypothetical protein
MARGRPSRRRTRVSRAPFPLTTLAHENADGSDLRTTHHAPQARMVGAAFAALAHLEQLLHL